MQNSSELAISLPLGVKSHPTDIVIRFLSPLMDDFYIYNFKLKARVHLNAVFSSLNIDLMLITRSRFKQLKIPMVITRSYVVGYFVNFGGIFGYIWEEIFFSQRIS